MRFLALIISLVMLSGCSIFHPPHPDDPEFAPVKPGEMRPAEKMDGGLYQEQYSMNLFESIKAKHVGDILTVLLLEKTDASKKATISEKKDNAVAVTNPTLFGQPFQFSNNKTFQFDLAATRKFDGNGASTQNNKLEGSITVSVSEVLPNGNLRIRGEKWLTINQGQEFIRLKGIVRQADVTPENTIRSDRIADARITYSGTGQVANSSIMGWLSKFFWAAFFPF